MRADVETTNSAPRIGKNRAALPFKKKFFYLVLATWVHSSIQPLFSLKAILIASAQLEKLLVYTLLSASSFSPPVFQTFFFSAFSFFPIRFLFVSCIVDSFRLGFYLHFVKIRLFAFIQFRLKEMYYEY